MKTGNVILAIFLWLLIPVVGLFSGIGGAMSGGSDDASICCFTSTGILFIIGLAVLLMGRETSGFASRGSTSTINERFCPNCGRVIPYTSNICPFCKKDFKAHLKDDKDKSEEKEEVKSKMKGKSDREIFCSSCGKTIPDDSEFCAYCGEKFDNSDLKICKSCGKENTTDGKFCMECGSKL